MSADQSQVVVGFDFSQNGRIALERAIGIAARAPFHVLHFICVVEPHHALPTLPTNKIDFQYTERVQVAMTDEIEAELKCLAPNASIHFIVHVRIGKPADEILGLAKDVGADLIVLGSKGLTGVERLVLGSVSEKVAREAGCTVEIARPKKYDYVELLDVKEVEAHHHYVAPHRYSYEDKRIITRPSDFPIG